MGDVLVVGPLGCGEALPTGPVGAVLTVGTDGEPAWLPAGGGSTTSASSGTAGSPTGVVVDFCTLTVAEVACLAQALRGELVTDAFGVQLGYLLLVG